VLLSTDGRGEEWASYPIPGAFAIRYGAYPSARTWYVTEGYWPQDAAEPFAHAAPHLEAGVELSANIRVGKPAPRPPPPQGVSAGSGYVANIYKTTDGGASFTKVFASGLEDAFYFNAISCGSENSCVAVADGEEGDGKIIHYKTYAYYTDNGGKTWSKVFDGGDNYVSLMAVSSHPLENHFATRRFMCFLSMYVQVKMTSASDGWISPSGFAPGSNSPTDVATYFMRTTDGGATWALNQTLLDCISSDIESAEGLTISTCLTAGGLSSRVAFYQ